MAHSISNKPQGLVLSSAVTEITVSVDGDFVDVSLSGPGGVEVLAERYYAYSGYVTLYDLRSLMEMVMRSSGVAVADFKLKVYSGSEDVKADSCVFHVLYCDRFSLCSDVPALLKENFLSTLSMRRIAPDSTLSLSLFAEEGESISYSVACSFRIRGSEEIRRHSFSADSGKTAVSSDVVQLNISAASLCDAAATSAGAKISDVELLSYTVTCGQRSMTFFVDRSLRDSETFWFRNCFNVIDFATLPSVSSAKTDVDRTLAVVNGRSRFYNQSTEKTYEVQSGPLTSDEADFIDQLFSSYEVYRIEPDVTNEDEPFVLAPVLVTDSTCEILHGDEKLNSVKFTWRYADNRPIVHLSISPGIFTSPYNIAFC